MAKEKTTSSVLKGRRPLTLLRLLLVVVVVMDEMARGGRYVDARVVIDLSQH
jgi:hypothetical protein